VTLRHPTPDDTERVAVDTRRAIWRQGRVDVEAAPIPSGSRLAEVVRATDGPPDATDFRAGEPVLQR
jgi:hypothetical protein